MSNRTFGTEPTVEGGSLPPLTILNESANWKAIGPASEGLSEIIVGRHYKDHDQFDNKLNIFGEALAHKAQKAGVSAMHFAIRAQKIGETTGFYIRDLESTNGTVVNGQRIFSGNLHSVIDGDIVTIGANFQFRVVIDGDQISLVPENDIYILGDATSDDINTES